MNDVTYLEAARKMAERMMREGGAAPAARIALWVRAGDGAPAERREAEILLASFHYYLRPVPERSGGRDQVS